MIASFVLSEGFVWVWCGGVIALPFLLSTIWFYAKSQQLYVEIHGLNNRLKSIEGQDGFVAAFEEYNDKARTELGLAWTEFVETLIRPKPGSGNPIRNTSEVSRYLNDATIIFPQINFRFFQSVPNLLTGLGILGTFIGLAVGIGAATSGITSGTPDQITTSLTSLLSGASLAFWTSIIGISASIIFRSVLQRISRKVHLEMSQWVGEIESRMERVTVEEAALQQVEHARDASKQLKNFNTELKFALEEALEEKVAKRLSPQLESLLEAVNELRTDRSTDAGQVIKQTLDQFTRTMQEYTGSQFDEMAGIVENLNHALKTSVAEMGRSQKDVREALEAVLGSVRTSMDEGTTAMTQALHQSLDQTMRKLAEASQDMADRMTASSTETANDMRRTLGTAIEDISRSGIEAAAQVTGSSHGLQTAAERLENSIELSERQLTSMRDFTDQINNMRNTIESTFLQMAEVSEAIGISSKNISDANRRVTDSLDSTSNIVGELDAMIRKIEGSQQVVTSAWREYQDRFEGIDDSLADVFKQIDEGLAGYCEKVSEFAQTLDGVTANTIQQLAGANSELMESIEELNENLRRMR